MLVVIDAAAGLQHAMGESIAAKKGQKLEASAL
jgi:hypothetical protein